MIKSAGAMLQIGGGRALTVDEYCLQDIVDAMEGLTRRRAADLTAAVAENRFAAIGPVTEEISVISRARDHVAGLLNCVRGIEDAD